MILQEIDNLHAKLKTLRPLSAGEVARLNEDFMIEYTYDSNAIEGSTLTLRETYMVLKADITIGEKPLSHHLEAVGHKDAFNYVCEMTRRATELDTSTIKGIHSLVMASNRDIAGVYRNVDVRILGAVHTPPNHIKVSEMLDELLVDYAEMKKNMHIVEAVSEFHLRFEGIHPFHDGNGRTGRLIMNFELIKAGLLPVNIKFTDRRKYYDCFDDYYGDKRTNSTLTNLISQYEKERLEERVDTLIMADKSKRERAAETKNRGHER